MLTHPLLFLTAPDFVSSMEDEDHVYFFFRESAVEYINCGKVTSMNSVSRRQNLHRFPTNFLPLSTGRILPRRPGV